MKSLSKENSFSRIYFSGISREYIFADALHISQKLCREFSMIFNSLFLWKYYFQVK